MGAPELAGDGKWGTLRRREAERELVDAYVAAWTASYERAELLTLCEAAQVPCGPVYAIDEIFADPQYQARGNIVRVKDERAGEIAIPNVVPRLSDTPGRVKWLGPPPESHNDEVYRGLLGLSAADIAALRASGAI
jgi:succinyl-CoA:(S)-malate CoA-transferase subunit B